MQSVAAGWLVLETTGSAARTGLVVALQALPTLLLGPWIGRQADRSRASQRVLVVTQSALAVSALCAAFGVLSYTRDGLGPQQLSLLLMVLAFANGAIGAVEGPHFGRFSLALIGEQDIPAALSLGALLSSMGRIVGTASAGMLAVLGAPLIFFFNSLTFFAVALTLKSVKPRHVVAVVSQKTGRLPVNVWLLLGLSVILGGIGRNYQVTLAALCSQMGFGVKGYSAATSIFAIGAALGGVVAVGFGRRTAALFFGLATASAVVQFSIGSASHLPVILALVLLAAVVAVLIDVFTSTLVQTGSGVHVRGRVVALQSSAGALGAIMGAPTLGWLAQWQGARTALHFAGVVCLIFTAIGFGLANRDALRHQWALVPLRCNNSIAWMRQRRHNWAQSRLVLRHVPSERFLRSAPRDQRRTLPESGESKLDLALQR